MKKRLYTNNEKGFAFPFVLFFITLSFIVFSTSVTLYFNEMEITNNIIEDYKVKSLYIRAKNDLHLEQLKNLTSSETLKYPDGNVSITNKGKFNKYHHIQFKIKTNNDFTIYFNEYID